MFPAFFSVLPTRLFFHIILIMKHRLSKVFVLCAVALLCTANLSAASSMTTSQARDARNNLVAQARTYIGTPYVSGGTTSSGMDCSGLLYTITREVLNLQFPRTVSQQYSYCTTIRDSEREAGDLVFFKTVGDKISHVGLYVGNSQFIHAASDGPNTGVIMSSLNESYWKQHYYCSGRFLPSGKTNATAAGNSGSKKPVTGSSSVTLDFARILDKTDFELTAAIMTTMLTRTDIMLSVRGIDTSITASYDNGQVHPGVSLGFRYDAKAHIFQMPVTATIITSDALRLYIGPVIALGTPVVPGTTETIRPSFFPGIIGLSWQTPSVITGDVALRFCADASYVVYNTTEGAALNLLDSFISGFSFNIGTRVTLPRF